ncbi:hypothetical protein [Lacrimispora sp. 210928-DFI.3.58]|uniref:hypothetical protein n=1 Tax=Lacrimispora sp. 210928-DFI.3.58 TaxID=2883214 RepID=UPI001D07794E|nr:hypothetical protein [Lacrimispora sp. 210928-DFI.3.58]MCB7317149.1 hypothetical protein [Lacrimispora sp. 210928-DFI.3.58]
MESRTSKGLIKEDQNHTPMQGAAATAEPAGNTSLIVADILPEGKENAVSSEALCNFLGFGSVRELQKQIARERAAGAVILSTCQDDGGYFLPGNDQEVKEFIRTLESRGKKTLLALRSARKLLRRQEVSASAGENECQEI